MEQGRTLKNEPENMKCLCIRHNIPEMTFTDYLCQEKKEEGILPTLKTVDALIQRLEDYIEKRRRQLITAIRNNIDNIRINEIEKKPQKND